MKRPDLDLLELRIAVFLRYGVLVAGALMLVGWLSHLHPHGNRLAAFHDYHPASFTAALDTAWRLGEWGTLLSYAGLFVLISLPVLRVLMTGVLFAFQGERRLAAIAFFVLAVLALSFGLGFEL